MAKDEPARRPRGIHAADVLGVTIATYNVAGVSRGGDAGVIGDLKNKNVGAAMANLNYSLNPLSGNPAWKVTYGALGGAVIAKKIVNWLHIKPLQIGRLRIP